MDTLGRNIRKRREELKLTQEELAYKLGYADKSAINKKSPLLQAYRL